MLQTTDHQEGLVYRRIALVSCFLNLPDIKEFKPFSGSGFKDFTAIVNHSKNYSELNPQSLTKFIDQIKSKIISYEFK